MHATKAKPKAVLLTVDENKFISSLKEGDVLLFDSLRVASQLIKLALNRPVNHSAIYVGDERYADANERPAGEPTVLISNLRDLIASRKIRTVTALRHKEVVAGNKDATSVMTQVKVFTDQPDTRFSYMSLVILAVPQLERIYKQLAGDAGIVRRVMGEILDAASKSLMSAVSALGDAHSLTCSEFVYRCYAGADSMLDIEITDPPATWTSGRSRQLDPGHAERFMAPTSGLGGAESDVAFDAPGVVSAIDLVAFRDDMSDVAVGFPSAHAIGGADLPQGVVVSGSGGLGRGAELSGSGGLGRGAAWNGGADFGQEAEVTDATELGQEVGANSDFVTVAQTAFVNLVQHNLQNEKYGDPTNPAVDTGRAIPDAVTPRDLWGSPSLVACSVLHRPPRQPDDSSGLEP